MPYKKPVLTRNLKKGITVFDPDKNNSGVEWQGAGDSAGGDFQSVPPEIANSPSFARALKRGIFEIVSNEEYENALFAQQDQYERAQAEKAERAASLIDESANREIVEYQCVGPQDRGDGSCGVNVIVEDIEENPPLCTKHASLKNQFVKTEDWSSTGKKEKVVTWNRVVLGQREVGRSQ